jgi:ABC-2 type transport system ATP-binding protein
VDVAVEVRDLTIRYGDLVAVDALSFDAPAGAVTALLGPNGAGKTSTIETEEGYRRPDSGHVRVRGADPIAQRREVVAQLGIMLQDGGVYPGIRPGEALELFASYYDDPLRPDELLERVGLSGVRGTPFRRLSGGEKQRLSLALALVGRPSVAVLDEPTAGLDVAGRRLVREIVDELRGDGVAVLLATHDLADAEAQADRVVIIDRGSVVAQGSLKEVLAGTGDEIRFSSVVGLDVGALAVHLAAPASEVAPGEYVVAAAPEPAVIARLTAWLADQDAALGDLRAGRQRLDEVFSRLTDGGQDPDR